jgi:hypothetical protein
MWKHLHRGDDAHRLVWLELKGKEGQLAAAGQEEMQVLRNTIAAGLNPGTLVVKPLQGAAKATMDRLVAKWIVNTRQPIITLLSLLLSTA